MEINAYLGQKGYTISKNELTVEKQKQIRNDLTIKPFVMGSPMNDNQKSFPAYRESANKFYVPHYYGVENFGPPKQYKVNEGTDINLEFAGILRDYQEPVVNKFIQHCNDVKYGGGLLELPCAWGKTSASLYVLSKLKKKALVIVHKEFLMNQWIERIQQFLPKARVGKIQGQIIDIEDKDIVIGMLQSLSMKEYPASTFETFGLTIIDEVHHIYLFMHTNPFLAILALFVAYNLIRRSSMITGLDALQKYAPSEEKKSSQFTAYNQFPYTLEQEVVAKMAPISQSGYSINQASYKPLLEELHDASPI